MHAGVGECAEPWDSPPQPWWTAQLPQMEDTHTVPVIGLGHSVALEMVGSRSQIVTESQFTSRVALGLVQLCTSPYMRQIEKLQFRPGFIEYLG